MDLVGRDSESTLVLEAVERARAGPGSLLILGDIGSGKTSLLRAATDRAIETGCLVLAVQGCAAEAEQSFAALHQLLRPVLAELSKLAPHLREAVRTALGIDSAPGGADPTALRVAVLTLLGELAAERPVVLIVDDVQLVDQDSCDVLTFVLRRLTTERIAVVLSGLGSVRPTRVEASVPVLLLGPLADAAAARLIDGLPDAPTGRARLEVLRQAGGSPLALIELSRGRVRDGGVRAPGLPLRRGGRIQEMFTDRLRALPAHTRRLLVYAAAAEGSGLATTMAAAGAGDDLSGWAPAEQAGLLTVGGDGVRFQHPLVRAAVYEAASVEVRAQVHRDLAAALRDDPARYAWHLAEAAVVPDESVALELEKTADLARLRGGVYAAARALERAAECTPEPSERARRYSRAISEADDFGDPVWIRELYERVVELTDDPDILGVAATAAGRALSLSAHQREAFAMLHDALRYRRPHTGGTALALTCVLAAVAVQSGLPEHRTALSALLARLDDDDQSDVAGLTPLASRLVLHESVLVHSDPVRHAVRLIRNDDAALHQPLTGPAELIRLLCLGSVAWFADESDLRVTSFRQVLTMLGQRRWSHGMVLLCVPSLASAMIATGRWTEAAELIEEITATAAVHRLSYLAADLEALRAELTALRGRSEVDTAALESQRWSIDVDENRMTHARLLRASGLVALVSGDAHTAYRRFRELFAPDGTPRDVFLSARSVADLASAARLSGDGDDAAFVVAAVRAQQGERPTTRMRLLLHHADALIGETDPSGRSCLAADIERAYRLAVIDPAGEQWPIERAQARLDYARWLRRRRRPLDAKPLLTAALETFTTVGAAGLADLARGELRASGAAITSPVAADPLDVLTSQQREIVRLAARGLRNREIAEQLFLSPRTVGSHLHNAYPKLGISGRHQLRHIKGS